MRAAALALIFAMAGCGARSALHAPSESDASVPGSDTGHGRDAASAPDTGSDAAPSAPDVGSDAAPSAPDVGVDAGSCGAPVSLPARLLFTETMRSTTLRTDVHIDTTEWEPTPTVIADSWTWLERGTSATRLDLAHASDDTMNWWVDNFILFETFDCAGTRIDAAFVGFTNGETVRLDGVPVRQIGRGSFEFLPGEIQLDSLVPAGVPVRLHATALDYGSWVSLGELWVIAR